MTNTLELITQEDRVALAARDAIFVLSMRHDAQRTRVFVTGPDERRTRAAVAERLGRELDVLYCGDLPREVRPRPCWGYERDPGCLDLRFALRSDQQVADVEIVEDNATVVVLGLICLSAAAPPGEPVDRVIPAYLSRPLGERTVIDAFNRERV